MAKSIEPQKTSGIRSLEDLFEFTNADIESSEASHLVGPLMTYVKFLSKYDHKYPFLNYSGKLESYMEGILIASSPETQAERKGIFIQLQNHYHLMFKAIINAGKAGIVDGTDTLMEMKGCYKVQIDSKNDRLTGGFWPDGIEVNQPLSIEKETLLANLIFSEFINDCELKPSRFGVCKRSKCKNYYYQYTGKKKAYCSTKCGNADRQHEYQKKQKGMD